MGRLRTTQCRPPFRAQCRPLARPLASVGVGGGPIVADRYVSATASNGYVVGSNANDGLTPETAWLTLEHAIINTPSGGKIAINDGTYRAATFFSIAAKSLTLQAQRTRQAILEAADAQARIINFTVSAASHTLTLIGLKLDGRSNTQRAVAIGSATPALGIFANTVMTNCEVVNCTQRAVHTATQKSANLTINSLVVSGAYSASIINAQSIEQGDIDINGISFNATATANAISAVEVFALGAAVTANISGVSGSFTNTAASASMNGVLVVNVNDAVIESCDLDISGATLGTQYRIASTSATLTANNGIIRNNSGHNGCNGGYNVLYGADFTTVGDNRHNNATINNNNLTANPDAATAIHGLMLGYGTGGTVYDNTITGAGLALLVKEQIGGEFYGNTVNECKSEAIRSKGGTGTVFRNNTINIESGFPGDCVVVDANITPATPSTGVEITGNVFNVAAAPTNVVRVDVGSDAVFTGNTYNIATTLGADPWEYQGTAYQTLAAWKAAIEPTAQP